jgi:hypothetical protein
VVPLPIGILCERTHALDRYVNEGVLAPLITGLVQTMLFLIHSVAIVVDVRRRKATPAIQLPTEDETPRYVPSF